jgi:hypothetical protein
MWNCCLLLIALYKILRSPKNKNGFRIQYSKLGLGMYDTTMATRRRASRRLLSRHRTGSRIKRRRASGCHTRHRQSDDYRPDVDRRFRTKQRRASGRHTTRQWQLHAERRDAHRPNAVTRFRNKRRLVSRRHTTRRRHPDAEGDEVVNISFSLSNPN